MEHHELMTRFEHCTLSPEAFGHREHVQVAWCCLDDDPLPAALTRFCDGLRRFAVHHGAPGKVHETITLAYLLLIHERRERIGPGTPGPRSPAPTATSSRTARRSWPATTARRRWPRTSPGASSSCPTGRPGPAAPPSAPEHLVPGGAKPAGSDVIAPRTPQVPGPGPRSSARWTSITAPVCSPSASS